MRSTAAVQRFDALDSLRCVAVLLMVQGHAFYLTLSAAERNAFWYPWHSYVHGYTAPGFMFGAGLAFGFTTLSDRIDQHARWTPMLRQRLYRYLSLIVIGYALQLPPLAENAVNWLQSDLNQFARVEALQHIGAALLFCQLLVILLRRPMPVAVSTLVLGAVIVLSGPAVSRVPAQELGPLLLAGYWTSGFGSTFPLVPWAGFVLVGVTLGACLRRLTGTVPLIRIAGAFAIAGIALVALSLQLDQLWPDAFGPHRYWKVSPYFFLRRLGWLMIALGALTALDAGLQRMQRRDGSLRIWVRRVGQHSLLLYVAHLLLLYGSPISPGLKSIFEGRLDVWHSAGLVVLIFIALALMLLAWEALEARQGPRFARVRRLAVAVVAITVMLAAVRAGGRILSPAVEPPYMPARGAVATNMPPTRADKPSDTAFSLERCA
ncbi:MAG: heparan-alpha-glucosaminide N-acetyltransferase domain-containing protein [Lysobacterales bacterium]